MGKKEDEQLQTAVKTLVMKLCSSDEFVSQLSDSITKALDTKFNKQIKALQDENIKIKAELNKLQEINNNLVKNFERIDGVLRCKNLRFYGIKENKNEKTKDVIKDIVSKKLGLKMSNLEIESCFRVGEIENDKVRPIVATFSHLDLKKSVYNSKKKLKGTGIVIREDLTKNKLNILKTALEKVKSKGIAWTNNCNIFVKYNDGEDILKISNEEDAEKL